MGVEHHKHTGGEAGPTLDGSSALEDKSVPSAKLDDSLIKYAEIEISSTEILALYTTPKELVATPGAGKVLEFISLELVLDYVSAAYGTTNVGNIAVHYTDASGASVTVNLASAGFIDQTTDQIRLIQKIATNVTPVINAALVLAVDGTANPTTGNSPIHAKVAYRVHETGL